MSVLEDVYTSFFGKGNELKQDIDCLVVQKQTEQANDILVQVFNDFIAKKYIIEEINNIIDNINQSKSVAEKNPTTVSNNVQTNQTTEHNSTEASTMDRLLQSFYDVNQSIDQAFIQANNSIVESTKPTRVAISNTLGAVKTTTVESYEAATNAVSHAWTSTKNSIGSLFGYSDK